ncbi:cell wall integrity and stress response component [Ophiocordyceps camponoti-floridani]|uniref:Cell wall integrity and stress response component n=1 Tax=Ophiocordyceps camponoti-floridani TaxID=2030778 RepID=A0A8H4VBN2_9HYPO|nr:cell wall integrity and stress response component [Ophiocordyceps camponoti-floridani]
MAASSIRGLCPLFLLLACVSALDFNLCASFNTADSPQNISIYQTNGLCHDFCLQNNQAYGITQGNSCWCSDYTPAKDTQVDKSKCDRPCPAYPDESCGGQGVFGYLALNNIMPSGTKGPSKPDKPQPTSVPPPSAETPTATAWVTKTVQDTVTPLHPPSPSSSNVVPRSSTDEATISDPPSPTPPSSSSSSSASPTSIIQTVTADGRVQYITVMPTPSASSSANTTGKETADDRTEQSGLGKGAVVGLTMGIIAAAAATAAMGLYMWVQRKKRRGEDYPDDPSIRGSSSGILGGRPEVSGIPGSPESTGNRSSTLQIDPRMDPFKQGLYARSGSHESINTLRDEHDYSRRIQQPKVLRAMNPDPVAED